MIGFQEDIPIADISDFKAQMVLAIEQVSAKDLLIPAVQSAATRCSHAYDSLSLRQQCTFTACALPYQARDVHRRCCVDNLAGLSLSLRL